VQIYLIICVARVILSWLQMDEGGWLGAIQSLTFNLTEPVFASVRRFMPTMGDLPIDFSPIVIFLILGFLRQIVCAF